MQFCDHRQTTQGCGYHQWARQNNIYDGEMIEIDNGDHEVEEDEYVESDMVHSDLTWSSLARILTRSRVTRATCPVLLSQLLAAHYKTR